MAVAKLYPEPEKGGRGKKNSSEKEAFVIGTSAGKVSEARTVLKWLPEIADLVMAGTKPLNDAYQDAPWFEHQLSPARCAFTRGVVRHGEPRPPGVAATGQEHAAA